MPRKSKAALAAEAAAPEATPEPARRGRPPRAPKAKPKPSAKEAGDVSDMIAADAEATSGPNGPLTPMAEPMDADNAATESVFQTTPGEPMPSSAEDAAAPPKPAARWDPAADTVQFDWPEIEQTASRPGPNQVMAKLLVAARAEGATSRWPFGEA